MYRLLGTCSGNDHRFFFFFFGDDDDNDDVDDKEKFDGLGCWLTP